jgi:pimeloyl-ACP methyl ester carboxylesterase
VHGIGVHPNWPDVIEPLRTRLPEAGWSTLAIQMPVLPNEATDNDYAPLIAQAGPRLEAAIAFLKDQGAQRIAIVAHSLGATMVNDYLATAPDAVDAYVAIGMSSVGAHAGRDNVALLGQITTPTLDLFGEHDLEAVVAGAEARARAAADDSRYSQAQVPDADHFFAGQNDALVETVSQWLNDQVPAP